MALLRVAWTLSCVAWSSAVTAQDERRLELRGSSSCFDARVLRARISHYLGGASMPTTIAIDVVLARETAVFRLLRGGQVLAERRFERERERCAEWRDALALAIAVAIEHAPPPSAAGGAEAADTPAATSSAPSTAAAQPASPLPAAITRPTESAPVIAEQGANDTADIEPELDAEPEPEPESEADPQRAPPQELARRPTERWMVHVGGVYLLEALPAPAPALKVGAEHALVPTFRIGLAGLMSANIEVPFEGGRVENQLFGGQVTACLNSPLRPAILLGCAGASAGHIRARGLDYTLEQRAGMFWLGILVRAAIELPATSTLALRVSADARANLLRPELRLNRRGSDPIGRAILPIGGSFAIDFVLRVD
jgi:hypothetical protein